MKRSTYTYYVENNINEITKVNQHIDEYIDEDGKSIKIYEFDTEKYRKYK